MPLTEAPGARVSVPSDRESGGAREVVVVGAGPAGLACAWELTRLGFRPVVFDRQHCVGGLARTETSEGYRFDIGGHRFYTGIQEVTELWRDLMGDELLERPRLSRIYHGGHFYRYPLQLPNVLAGVGIVEGARVVGSYLASVVRRVFRRAPIRTFEEWVTHAFGRRLFETFFRGYTEKVWGTPCSSISAEWAAQRIRKLTLGGAIRDALTGGSDHRTLSRTFHYPRLGPGQVWERLADRIRDAGGEILLETEVLSFLHDDGRVKGVTVRDGASGDVTRTRRADHVVSTIPLRHLALRLDPSLPKAAHEAAMKLQYRGLIEVVLILEGANPFPDTWIYVHEPGLRVARIQNFQNWSPDMVPEGGGHSVGLEYFCQPGGDLWNASDEELVELAWSELEALELGDRQHGRASVVIREPEAYPVYSPHYREHLEVLRERLEELENLQTVGRNGTHRYNNMDHSVLMGLLAARNVAGAAHPVWDVNTARSYYETFQLG